jgi:NAD(P)H dehydrogenase (quinone)
MRVLVLYAHPVETSFNAALHETVVQALRRAGHDVDDCDLYAEGFSPVLTREERLGYHEVPANRSPVDGYVERLLWAEALVICTPVWNFGFPAILKGRRSRTSASSSASPPMAATGCGLSSSATRRARSSRA